MNRRAKSEREIEDYQAAPGKLLTCALRDLVQEIRISPTSEEWIENAIHALCELVNLDVRIVKSDLSSDPIR